jgi:nucleoside-diphosphate-sugar epimerase
VSRIFLAGAAGAIGRRLTPLLCAAGHSVWGTTRSPERIEFVRGLGAYPVMVDVFDAEALAKAVLEAKPEIVIHQLTDLAEIGDPARAPAALARNARIRDEGTRNLVAAARQVRARRLIAQSIAWAYAPGVKPYGEDHPLDLDADGPRGVSVRGVASLERQVIDGSPAAGLVLRYGRLYGPGSGADAPRPAPAVHVDAAAYAALRAVDHGEPGLFNIADPSGEVSTTRAIAEFGWARRLQDRDGLKRLPLAFRFRALRYPAKPSPVKPTSVIAQVEGSGTAPPTTKSSP